MEHENFIIENKKKYNRGIKIFFIFAIFSLLSYGIYTKVKSKPLIYYKESFALNTEHFNCDKDYIVIKVKPDYTTSIGYYFLSYSCGFSSSIFSTNEHIIVNTKFDIKYDLSKKLIEVYTNDTNVLEYSDNISNLKNVLMKKSKSILVDLNDYNKKRYLEQKEKEQKIKNISNFNDY